MLSVATPGAEGRNMGKVLEALMVTNNFVVAKRNVVTQFLFGGDGFKIQ